MAAEFSRYPHLTDIPAPEAGFKMTTDSDYLFDTYEQPASTIPTVVSDPSRLSRLAGKLEELDSAESDLKVNRAIISASAVEVRDRPPAAAPEGRESVSPTYEPTTFARDTHAAYATDSLCAAWLELYYRQVETGDYPVIMENKAPTSRGKLHRLVPRQIADRLPDGSVAARLEIYLGPELYLEYRAKGLIPDTPGGQGGVPRIYWFEHDGDGYKAGTNADRIYRTDNMRPLSMATLRGSNNTVRAALNSIPLQMTTLDHDAKEQRELAEAKEAARWRPSYRYPLF